MRALASRFRRYLSPERPSPASTPCMVTRVENEATINSGGASTTALVGTVLHLKDELRTGTDARLQVTFRDSTTLTLGENATVVIDRYVFDPDQSVGEASINAFKGAVRFATGKNKSLNTRDISVSTSVATLGVRGTDFWTGPFRGALRSARGVAGGGRIQSRRNCYALGRGPGY